MGKSSKKRKRGAEIASADCSVNVSEQAEEEEESSSSSSSAVDVEAGYVNPLDSLKPGEYKRLVLKSLDDSIAMYERFESQGKELPRNVTADILSRLKESREALEFGAIHPYAFIHLNQDMKYYFFTRNWEDSPYERLRINRFEEDGQLVLPGIEDMMDETNLDYVWATKESHQYVILWDELKFLIENKEWEWDQKLGYAKSIAKTRKLDLLSDYTVKACLQDVLGSQDDKRVVQQLEYHRYLFKNEAKSITDEEQLWRDVKEKYPLLIQYVFRHITNLFYPSGKKCEQKKLKEIIRRVESCYELAMKTRLPLPVGQYYKLKLQLARKFGIVKYDSKGFLVDNYNSSEWKIP